jgi:hypothetical protein
VRSFIQQITAAVIIVQSTTVVIAQESLVVVDSVAVFAFAAATVDIVCANSGTVIEAMM